MRIAVIIIRILMGLMFLFSSVVVLFKLVPMPALSGDVKTFMDGLMVSRYLFPLIKITELVCAIAFLVGRFVPLANVVLFPVTLNIVLYHAFVLPDGLLVAILLLVGHLVLAYAYRDRYSAMLSANSKVL
ncbi:DoxX family membrane protein [Filimonas effusa]|uniref:DoxX family membrane protein n=1 Tax=Filimonas effusa TaxID=2508721 RepID=A0A4Q1CZJ1_9BACT|nr:DoxX family membrane protein [Filimonas effusa]RXK80736.1 DoxX family membrane protein [Filimonas effusa]